MQRLLMAVLWNLKDVMVYEAADAIVDENVGASPYGLLFELALVMTHEHLSYGTLTIVYDDMVVVRSITHFDPLGDET